MRLCLRRSQERENFDFGTFFQPRKPFEENGRQSELIGSFSRFLDTGGCHEVRHPIFVQMVIEALEDPHGDRDTERAAGAMAKFETQVTIH